MGDIVFLKINKRRINLRTTIAPAYLPIHRVCEFLTRRCLDGVASHALHAYFKWNKARQKFQKFPIVENSPGIGLQIRVVDLDGNGWKDIVVAGKSGTHILWNDGK